MFLKKKKSPEMQKWLVCVSVSGVPGVFGPLGSTTVVNIDKLVNDYSGVTIIGIIDPEELESAVAATIAQMRRMIEVGVQ